MEASVLCFLEPGYDKLKIVRLSLQQHKMYVLKKELEFQQTCNNVTPLLLITSY
jgi:hypothetical protein